MDFFDRKDLSSLYFPPKYSFGGQNGQVTIIGGSYLFHGVPILALKSASKIVDMVFFASALAKLLRRSNLSYLLLFGFLRKKCVNISKNQMRY